MNKIILLIFLLSSSYFAAAQSTGPAVLNAAGGQKVIGGNTYEYAIGHMIEGSTYSSATLVVTPWVLQPKVEEPNSAGNIKISSNELNVFPNPVEQMLFIQPNFGKAGKMSLLLTDIQGRNMLQHSVDLNTGNERQQIDMTHLAQGQYQLNVIWQQNTTTHQASFKIQKIK